MRILLTAILPALLLFSGHFALAQSICGQFRLLSKNGTELRDFLDNYSLAGKVKRQQCGLVQGEDFAICGKCSDAIPPDFFKHVKPMLAAKEKRQWHTRWH